MPRRFDLIVFDWDGTLMDSAGHIASSIQAACLDLGVPAPGDAAARHVIGLGLEEALVRAVPTLDRAHYPRLAERYRHHYLTRDRDLSLFEGASQMLAELHAESRLLAVATGKSRRGLDRALEVTGLAGVFHATRCADECHSKPHPQMLLELMDVLGVDETRTLMIGDTTHDLDMAKNARVAAVAVTFGAHPREDLVSAEPLACLNSTRELATWLKTNA